MFSNITYYTRECIKIARDIRYLENERKMREEMSARDGRELKIHTGARENIESDSATT